jgi:hypothetical protein
MKLFNKRATLFSGLAFVLLVGCKLPAIIQGKDMKSIPDSYTGNSDSSNSAKLSWKQFFVDKNLQSLIEIALDNNLEMMSTLQNIEIARNNFNRSHGQLLPSVKVGGALGLEKVGRYTSQGAGDASAEITPGKLVPEWLPDMYMGFQASWEADIWGKLHTAKKAAYAKYLGSIDGMNFVKTNLVAEIANSYYELLALDNQLYIIKKNISLQQDVLEIVKVQKQASVVTELAVKQFEAQLFSSQGMEYEVLQAIAVTENRINFLLGRYPQKIQREANSFSEQLPMNIQEGVPAQLLENRPDIRQAAQELISAKLDVRVAQLEFYPSLGMTGLLGLQAFKPRYFFAAPESLAFMLAGDLAGPIINRTAIKSEFKNANAYQIQALYEYQKSVLNGFNEVSSEMSNIRNLEKVYRLKSLEADTRSQSIEISNDLFKSARANYLEVLMAQREALDTKLELVETKKRQYNAVINVYKALGGGWR